MYERLLQKIDLLKNDSPASEDVGDALSEIVRQKTITGRLKQSNKENNQKMIETIKQNYSKSIVDRPKGLPRVGSRAMVSANKRLETGLCM